ncbi:30S ribosomal protein S16 [Candidatus Poriferisodalis sp.]|uniref:30S ribosomal protein S16 n=1 Tax=Candidatus Poriferisodalis sp. TaxID=3101277 RepID=UPI003B02A351
MAVRLRLKRTGKKKQPTYRVVAVDGRKPRDGRVLEVIGTYDPRRSPSAISMVNERAVHWLSHGAQPSDTVSKLLTISGAWEEFRSLRAPESVDAGTEVATPAADEPASAPPDLVLDAPEPTAHGSPAPGSGPAPDTGGVL